MKGGLRVALAVASAAAVLAPARLAAPPAHAAEPTRVMVVGDSISQGWGGDWTWRYWLQREAHRQGAAIDMVGPDSKVNSWEGTRYERNGEWDSQHAAVAGATVDFEQERIVGYLDDYDPDVLAVELGTNDLRTGDDAARLTADLERLIETAWSVEPGLQVLLAEVPNVGKAAEDRTGAAVNAAMASWAVGRPVTVVHNRTGYPLPWDPARYTFDNTHPNAIGQTLLAHRYAQALHAIGVLPEAPQGVYQDRVWSPDLHPTLTPQAGHVKVTWFAATSEVRVDRLRVIVDGIDVTGWFRVGMRDRHSVVLPVQPGLHYVQLQPARGRMMGEPGTPQTLLVALPG